MNARDIDLPWMHFFFYGESGSGKTEVAATFPRPVFIVPQNEGSIMTLRGRDIPFYEATDLSSRLVGGVGGLICIIDELEHAYYADMDAFPFETIVIESLTHYADLAIEQIGGPRGKMDQQKWGELSAHFRNIQARLRRIQVHAVFTSLARTDEADDGTLSGGPLIPGSTSEKLPSACELVAYCEQTGAGNKRRFRTHLRRYKHFAARFRVPTSVRHLVPDYMDDFSFQQVESLLQGNQQPKTEGGSDATSNQNSE
jgi:hypothetical protein